MGNLISYIKWRGDITFDVQPFNEIDNVILSEIAYFDFAGIVPEIEEKGSISLSEAIQRLIEGNKTDKTVIGMDSAFMYALKEAKRFADIQLFNFKDVSHLEGTDTDFSAVHMKIDDNTIYIAYRGTSGDLVGWQEDFSMSFKLMPSQQMALDYLNQTFDSDKEYYIGGHSKGGNLAVYAAAFASEEQLSKILQIYSNDGPGFCNEIISRSQLERIKDKVLHIVPEFCIVGELFEMHARTMIVKSELNGIISHDALSWQVEGNKFCTCEKYSDECKIYNEIFKQWIESADMEHRMAFTNQLFGALKAGGAKTLKDISQGGADDFLVILISITQSDGETRGMLRKLGQIIFSTIKNIDIEKLFREKEILKALFLFVLGIFIALNPMIAIEFAGTAIGLAGVIFVGKRQLDSAFSEQGTIEVRKTKSVVHMVVMCLIMYLISEKQILLQLSNLLIAVAFLLFSYDWLTKAFCFKKYFPNRVLGLAVSVVSFTMGIIPIIIDSYEVKGYMISVGALVWLYGIGIFVYNAYQNGQAEIHRKKQKSYD